MMREKYIDEKVGYYIIFGQRTDDPNLVDVSDGTQDVFTSIPRWQAEAICKAQECFREELYKILNTPEESK
jgi:hypothetical protein